MIDWATISLKDLAGFLCEELKKRGIDTVLVGGACVTMYSENRYQSYDLDYVTYEDMSKVKKALAELGFFEKHKYFQHEHCPWLVEFVSPPVAVGKEVICKFSYLKTSFGTIKCLRPIDSVKDRLAAFYHWNDKQSLDQAIKICLEHKINFKKLEEWSINEGRFEKFQDFKARLKSTRSS